MKEKVVFRRKKENNLEISYVFKKNITKNILMTELSNAYGLKKVLFWQKFNGILRKKQSYKIFKVVKRKNVFVQNNDKII